MKNPFRSMAIARMPSFHHEHPSYRWWVLGNILVTTFMSVLESTVVNTALPTMQSAFGTSLDIIEWVLTAFQIAFAIVLPFSGWLADKIGYKRTFLLSLVLFTFGSLACSFAWNEGILIFFRVIQGFGGGMIMPVGMAIVLREFPPQERGTAMGFYGIAAAASMSIGPSLGGVLVDNFGWASIFLINVPIGFLAMFATLVIQREYKNEKVGNFDWWGFISITVFLVSLLLALADGNATWNTGGWTSPFILTCFIIAIISFIIFLHTELTVEHPMVELSLFKDRNFALSNLLLFFVGLFLMGSIFLLPVYFQSILGYTALQSGLLILPLGLIQGAISPITGKLADKFNPKIPALMGITALIVSFYLNTLFSTNPPFWIIMAPTCLRGIGFGLLFISIQAVSVNSLPKNKIAQGSGLISLTRQVGSSFGVALFSAIITQRNTFHTSATAEDMNTWSEPFRQVAMQMQFLLTSNGGQTKGSAGTLSQVIIANSISMDSYVKSINDSFLIVALMISVCSIFIFLMKTEKKKKL